MTVEFLSFEQLKAEVPNALGIGPFGSSLKVSDYRSSGVPLVFVRDIRREAFGGADTKFVSVEKSRELQAHIVRPGDILITKMGDPPGDATVYPTDRPPAVITADCIKLTPNPAKVLADYVVFALRTPAIRNAILAEARGVAQQKLSLDRFRGIPIPVPSLEDQRAVVDRLRMARERQSSIRSHLASAERRANHLRIALLAAAFRGDLTKDWRAENPDVEPASKLMERIRVVRQEAWAVSRAKAKRPYQAPVEVGDTAELCELPRGWCWASIDQLTDATRPLCYGVVQPGESVPDGVRLVRVTDIEQGEIQETDLRTVAREVDALYGRSRVAPGDVLVSVVGTIGKVALVPDTLAGANIARALARVSLIGLVTSEWLRLFLETPEAQSQLAGNAREVARKTLNLADLAKLPIPIAPLEEQRQCVALLRRALGHLKLVQCQVNGCNDRLEALDRAMFAREFGDPTDERG